ncbi:RNA polymerase sigma factor [Rufibacter hautae]|uniref:RNA polymerase sigma factor n=1 Tax=Rufibacter hautae TaxID=2595005 RepID=UPI001CC1C72D|nr:sigma-70 family RNA polymerase sigma factor [Rufibacter hautae]
MLLIANQRITAKFLGYTVDFPPELKKKIAGSPKESQFLPTNRETPSILKEQFLLLIENHQGLIHKVCNMYCSSREDREDLFQEIVLQLWRSYPTFRGGSKVTTWMYRVALNNAITRVRKESKSERFAELGPEAFQVPSVEGDMGEEMAAMYGAIKKLSQVDQAIILLYLEDCSYREMAEVLGISESNVGVKLNRIKGQLRTLISKE